MMILLIASSVFATPAEQAAKTATDNWVACLKSNVASLQKSKEPAETVATAVMAACSDYRDKAEDAWLPLAAAANPADPTGFNRASIDRMATTFRGKVIGDVVRYRAGLE